VRGDVPFRAFGDWCHAQVFPACAGMFLSQSLPRRVHDSFPRVRGDVPSPQVNINANSRRFPRVRGDVPVMLNTFCCSMLFSPRARGCSFCDKPVAVYRDVFPACAGMFRNIIIDRQAQISFPRVRGDVPYPTRSWVARCRFSPRARGCSFSYIRLEYRRCVFPACAGMFRDRQALHRGQPSFPRVRGDVPAPFLINKGNNMFSPRARGCSWWCLARITGMNCFPRVRGDVPRKPAQTTNGGWFSPRARGCS